MTSTITFTSAMCATAHDFKTVPASDYERICKTNKNTYELIPDDKPEKLYFDIDIKGPADEYDGQISDVPEIIEYATEGISQFSKEVMGVEPVITIKSANSEHYTCWKDKSEKYIVSLHLVVNNITALKADQKYIVQRMNSFMNIRYSLTKRLWGGGKLFDESVYDKNRKLRSLYASKPNENRFFKLEQGSFEGSCISAFVPDNAVVYTAPPPEKQPTVPHISSEHSDDQQYDRMLFEKCLESGLFKPASKTYPEWRNVAFILKKTFGDEEGWELFDAFSKQDQPKPVGKYDICDNKEFWDKLTDDHPNPLGMGTLVQMMSEVDADKLKDIQRQVAAAKNSLPAGVCQINMDNIVVAEKVAPVVEEVNCKDDKAIQKRFLEMAADFEKTHCKIINKSIYIHETSKGIQTMTKKQLVDSYEHLNCGSKNNKPVSFILKWTTGNADIHRFDDMEIYAFNKAPSKCPPNIYNLWTPFAMQKLEGKPYIKKGEGLKFWLNHIKILCNHDEAVYNYLCSWIAQMLQYPETKTIMPVLVGSTGTGKSMLVTLLSKLIGSTKFFETTDPAEFVWGKFNSVMTNCFLVHLPELSKKEFLDNEGKVKGLITDYTLPINGKGSNAYTINSNHRFIATTNTEDPVPTDDKDRRNLIIRCSDEKKGDILYFEKALEYLADETVLRTLYDHFMDIPNMDKFHEISLPKTEHQTQMKEANRDPIKIWLEEYTLQNSAEATVTKTSNETHDLFIQWCLATNRKYEHLNRDKFMLKLKQLKVEGISTQKTKKGNLTVFDFARLEIYFGLNELPNE